MQTTIKLMSAKQLIAQVSIPKAPKLVQQYLDLENRSTEGRVFKIEIKQHNNPVSGHGIAYSNELIIHKKTDGQWAQVYTTGPLEYRGAYASDVDNKDQSFKSPAILNESPSELTFGISTGAGNVYIRQFNGKLKTVDSFDVREYHASKKRAEALQNAVKTNDAFRAYVDSCLGHHWYVQGVRSFENDKFILIVAGHADRDYDAIDDTYCCYLLWKDKGIGFSGHIWTEARHPGGKFYRHKTVLKDANLITCSKNTAEIQITVAVGNWSEERLLKITF